jgi:predicted helicase
LSGFHDAFKTFLIGTLTKEDFADLFAQTITYGLFAARTRADNNFIRRTAYDHIPQTIGVLRSLFKFLSLEELPKQLAWCVEDIVEVLAVSDASGILDRYYHEGKGSDPVVHFYETFLAKYDPAEREKRGVYYTPEPVVGYIVRSLHGLLKNDFDKPDGLASDGVTLLDPAAGTMTFIAKAAQQAVSEFETKYGTGGREDFIRRHILKNFYAFELMMAPYAVGHLKMSFYLEELGHRLGDQERVPFYLTNTLDNEEMGQSQLPGFRALAEESRLAGKVKKQTPILVILGNPPYSGHSSNIGEWISNLIGSYKQVDGKPLGERNPKWLQDDYVKFLRFAQWKIEQAGQGLVGMITNHSYLDNPTFRGMRQSLMQTFDEIRILDLHGNSLKKETCPDGSPDKNVFDIRAGVAIVFLVKHGEPREPSTPATVRHAELYGSRKTKYDWLDTHDAERTQWRKITPHSGAYLYVPRDERTLQQYESNLRINEVFPANVIGLFTARDSLTIHFSAVDVWKTVTVFSELYIAT